MPPSHLALANTRRGTLKPKGTSEVRVGGAFRVRPTISVILLYVGSPPGLRFRVALINSFFVNMAVGPMITKTRCSQSKTTAIAYLGAQKVCRIYNNTNHVQ